MDAERILITVLLALPLVGAYAINAIGIVVVYRASKVLNLAHGAMTMMAAYIAFQLAAWNLPRPFALLGGIVASGGIALLIERFFVRRLRDGGPVAQTIGTVAAFGVLVALAGRIWGTTSRQSVPVFPEQGFRVFDTLITYGQIGLFLSMLVIAGGLYLLLQRTYLGLVLRGTAENRLAASLMGADPDRMTQLAWVIGGVMAGLAGTMLAAIGTLHPYNLSFAALPAYVAALLGGMHSLPGAVLGAAAVGILQGLVRLVGPLEGIDGIGQLVVAVLVLVVMASRGARLSAAEPASAGGLESTTGDTPGWRLSRGWLAVAFAAAIAVPHLPFVSFSLLGNLNQAAIFAIVAVSLVILTGWVGQISLAHATFVGIGAFGTGLLTNLANIPFPLNLPIAAAGAAAVAAVLGVVALRVRGLYLAVATLIFAWMGQTFLFRQEWLTREESIFPEPIGRATGFPSFDITERHVFFYIAWAVVLLAVFVAANLRDTKTGRAFFAVKGSEVAAASLGIHVARYKLMAFVVSGAIAGAAGSLVMIQQRTVVADQFDIPASLFFLAVLVVGGVHSLGGAVAAGLLFGGIQELFFRFAALAEYVELVSALLLAGVLILYRRGLAGIPSSVAPAVERLATVWALTLPARQALARPVSRIWRTPVGVVLRTAGWLRAGFTGLVRRVRPEKPTKAPAVATVEPVVDSREPPPQAAATRSSTQGKELPKDRTKREALLHAADITVRFGGLTAADRVSLTVYEGEIVGLIGPNGAGKTTTFNAIAGLNEPSAGRVRMFGQDVTEMPVHERAGLGVGRTFQLIQLFPQLTVFDNLLVATHLQNESGLWSGSVAGVRCLIAEAKARRRVRDVIELLGLDDVADRAVAGLPFGVLRMVEVGRAMVAGPRLIMLDEPASGLDNAETDRLAQLLLDVRDLGVGLLLIEHDVRMVTSVSDYMYVIDQGKPLADGTPAEIQRNPAVIAAYLGEPKEREEGRRRRKAPVRSTANEGKRARSRSEAKAKS